MKTETLAEALVNTLTKDGGRENKATLADVNAEAAVQALADRPR